MLRDVGPLDLLRPSQKVSQRESHFFRSVH